MVDILVVSSEYVEEWKNVKGNILYPALREGKVLYESEWFGKEIFIKSKRGFNAIKCYIELLNVILNNVDVSDEIFGFHCQQSVEKMLKSILIYRGIEFRKTHDIRELIDILQDNEINLPDELKEIDILTPFAVEYRYDFYEEDTKVDRRKLLNLVIGLKEWAEQIIMIFDKRAKIIRLLVGIFIPKMHTLWQKVQKTTKNLIWKERPSWSD